MEEAKKLSIREIDLPDFVGSEDVKIQINTVGICGSDVHYFEHGKIGPFVVSEPMVLGHEASGTITAVGDSVKNFKIGDRVCMEPGIPNLSSKASKYGNYNVDPSVKFWATPPIHGCLTPSVIHPSAFTYKLPDNVSFAEGAMVEPFAIGIQAANKAKIKPGDIALVTGAGPIGIMVALAALAGGCSKVFISDLVKEKLDIAAKYENIEALEINKHDPLEIINKATSGWGADLVFECSGAASAIQTCLQSICPSGCLVLIGMPINPIQFDIVLAQSKEIRIETVFRYANTYERAISILSAGKVDLKHLISMQFPFLESISAFHRAAEGRPSDVKLQIVME